MGVVQGEVGVGMGEQAGHQAHDIGISPLMFAVTLTAGAVLRLLGSAVEALSCQDVAIHLVVAVQAGLALGLWAGFGVAAIALGLVLGMGVRQWPGHEQLFQGVGSGGGEAQQQHDQQTSFCQVGQ